MFKRIIVAFNESAEASRSITAAIQLAKAFSAELVAVTIFKLPPASTAFDAAVSPSLTETLMNDRREHCEQLPAEARKSAQKQGVELATHLAERQEVDAKVRCVARSRADLLVIGIHQHSLYVSRLWSTAYELAQEAPCSVLGIH
jgi:nucleotide-binding universal stress UspA family protein